MATKGEAKAYVVVYSNAESATQSEYPTRHACFATRARARAYIAEERRNGLTLHPFAIYEVSRADAEQDGYTIQD